MSAGKVFCWHSICAHNGTINASPPLSQLALYIEKLVEDFMHSSPICVEGKNCCSISRATRVALLIDGEAYFSALTSTLERAQRFIFIAGWQLDSRFRLNPRNSASPCFGDFLHDLVRRNRKLRIYVLLWDFAMIYAADREIIPLYSHPWRSHRRIHFRLDSSHPLGASHHQKIVVIDDAVAFSGGLDIAEHRWDTPDHLPQDPQRVDSLGRLYPPYHDVQLMVDGAAAATLGDIVRERWRRATGKRLRMAAGRPGDPWPSEVIPDLQHVSVAISRTEPTYDVRQEVREVESLYVDSIRHARRFIYLENQYLSSSAIGDALVARLQEKDGPEIIMVLPQETSEWLEQVSMAVLRSRLLKRLRAADGFGRLHVYYPGIEDENVQVRVHSKVCFIDDRLLRVGSANLNNRSMGLDTECDLAVEAEEPATENSHCQPTQPTTRRAFGSFARKGSAGTFGGTVFGASHREVAWGQAYLGNPRRFGISGSRRHDP